MRYCLADNGHRPIRQKGGSSHCSLEPKHKTKQLFARFLRECRGFFFSTAKWGQFDTEDLLRELFQFFERGANFIYIYI